ncbi:hypothetical protein D3C79_1062620 [compost metagenome]
MAVQKIPDGSIRIMVERIHILAPEASVLLYPVPMLPDGRRSLGHLVQPGRIIGLQEQFVGRIRMPGFT